MCFLAMSLLEKKHTHVKHFFFSFKEITHVVEEKTHKKTTQIVNTKTYKESSNVVQEKIHTKWHVVQEETHKNNIMPKKKFYD